jgi:hypothetical protein
MKYLKLFESFANFDADLTDSVRDIMNMLDIRSGNGWDWIDVKYKYDGYTGDVTNIISIDLIKDMNDSDQTFDIHEYTAVVPKVCLKTKGSIENKVCIIWKPEEEFEEYLAFFTNSDLDYDDKEKIEEMGFKYEMVKIYTDYKLKI